MAKKKGLVKKILIAVVVLMVIGGAVGGGNKDVESKVEKQETQQEATQETKKETKSEKPYTIENEEVEANEFSYKIVGKLTNNSGRDLKYVEIDYNLYDKDGDKVGQAHANTNDLKDGEGWKFEALAFDAKPEDVDHYEISDVKGF